MRSAPVVDDVRDSPKPDSSPAPLVQMDDTQQPNPKAQHHPAHIVGAIAVGAVVGPLIGLNLSLIADVLDHHEGTVVGLGTAFVALFTWALWRSTHRLQVVTSQTLNHLQREFVATHRPRLRIRQVSYVPDDDKPSVDFTIANVGDSTATILESSVKIWIVPINDEWAGLPPYDPPTATPRTRVLRNGDMIRWTETDSPGRFDLLIGDVANDRLHTVLLGYLVYADDTGIRRRVGFCRKRIARGNTFACVANPDYEYED